MTDLRSDSYIPGVNFNRQNVAVRLNSQPTKRLRINSSLNYVHSNSDNRPGSGYGSENIGYSLVAWLGRQSNIEALRDYWQPGLEGIQQFSFNYTFFDNPYLILLENRNSFDRDRVFGNVRAEYQINDRLSFMLRTGIDQSIEERNFRRAFSSNRFKNGAYAEHAINQREINTDFLLNYNNRFGDIGFDISVGANRLDQIGRNSQLQAIGLAQPGIFTLTNAASPLESFQFNFQKRVNSVYALAKLSYKNYLFVDITGRSDWSSALATPGVDNDLNFVYPSVSASLILSHIYEVPEFISFAKVRASWAQVGNDTNPYQTLGVFNPQTPVAGNPTFSAPTFIANQNLLPESSTAIEVGADLRFFDDRIGLDFTYFNALNENQILSLPLPISSGFNQRVVNGGKVRSSGVELVLGLKAVNKPNFKWNTFFNFSTQKAIVEELPTEGGSLTLAYSRVYDNVNQTVWMIVEEGGRIGDLWGTGYLRNDDGEFVVGADGRLIVDNTLKKLGNYNPDFILGNTHHLQYKNFGLSFNLDWRSGGELVSRTLALAGVGGQLIETEFRPEEGLIFDGVRNIGSDENPNYVQNDIAISPESFYRQYYDRNHEENNLYDASYLKLRSITLSYSVPNNSDNKFFRNFNDFTISLLARNVFAFSEINHIDPEQLAIQGNNFVRGVEDISYPTARSVGVSLNLKF